MAAKLCNVCGKRRNYTGTGPGVEAASHGIELCNYCYTEGGHENSHSDYDHQGILAGEVQWGQTTHKTKDEFEAWIQEVKDEAKECWICHPELNLAQKPVKAKAASKNAGYVRRPQFNHKGHAHPQSPAARRACKTAFWASLTPVANVSTNTQVAEAMAKWNYHCDAFGKPLAKPASWTVEPKGHVGTGIDKRKVKGA